MPGNACNNLFVLCAINFLFSCCILFPFLRYPANHSPRRRRRRSCSCCTACHSGPLGHLSLLGCFKFLLSCGIFRSCGWIPYATFSDGSDDGRTVIVQAESLRSRTICSLLAPHKQQRALQLTEQPTNTLKTQHPCLHHYDYIQEPQYQLQPSERRERGSSGGFVRIEIATAVLPTRERRLRVFGTFFGLNRIAFISYGNSIVPNHRDRQRKHTYEPRRVVVYL